MATYRIPSITSTPSTNDHVYWTGSLWAPRSTADALANIGNTRGQVLRRGASAWEALAAQTLNKVLRGDGTDIALGTGGVFKVTGAALAASSGTTTIALATTAPAVSAGNAGPTFTYAAASTASILIMVATVSMVGPSGGNGLCWLTRSTATAANIGVPAVASITAVTSLVMIAVYTPASVSTLTYQVRFASDVAGTTYLNRSSGTNPLWGMSGNHGVLIFELES